MILIKNSRYAMIIKELMIADYNLRNYESISMINLNI